jgi:hypothetical protein
MVLAMMKHAEPPDIEGLCIVVVVRFNVVRGVANLTR